MGCAVGERARRACVPGKSLGGQPALGDVMNGLVAMQPWCTLVLKAPHYSVVVYRTLIVLVHDDVIHAWSE